MTFVDLLSALLLLLICCQFVVLVFVSISQGNRAYWVLSCLQCPRAQAQAVSSICKLTAKAVKSVTSGKK